MPLERPCLGVLQKLRILSMTIKSLKRFNQTCLFKNNRIYVCLSVTKDLHNQRTDMVLLYSVVSHRSSEGL